MPSTIRFVKKFYKIAVIPGDGGGTEIMTAALRVLTALGEATQTFYCRYEFLDWNNETYKEKGYFIPEGGVQKLKPFHAVLCGPMGLIEDTRPEDLLDRVPDENTFQNFVKPIRHGLNHIISLQPIRPIRGAQHYRQTHPTPANERLDVLLVRANNEKWDASTRSSRPEGLESSREGIEHLLRTAFDLAQLRRLKVACVLDRESTVYDSKVWMDALSKLALEMPGVEMQVIGPEGGKRAAAVVEDKMAQTPREVDVLVGPSSELVFDPSLGMDAVGNVDPDAKDPALWQARRGGKDSLEGGGAGQIGVLSALAAINGMLTWLGRRDEADRLMEVVERTLIEGGSHDRNASDFAEEVIVKMKNVM